MISPGTPRGSPHAPQLFQVNLGPQEHFAAAWNLSLAMGPSRIEVLPLDQNMPQDTRLTNAANFSATQRGSPAAKVRELGHCEHYRQGGGGRHPSTCGRQCARRSRGSPKITTLPSWLWVFPTTASWNVHQCLNQSPHKHVWCRETSSRKLPK